MKITLTLHLTAAALARVDQEHRQDWSLRDLAQQIAGDIQQTSIGQAAGRGPSVTVTTAEEG